MGGLVHGELLMYRSCVLSGITPESYFFNLQYIQDCTVGLCRYRLVRLLINKSGVILLHFFFF